MSCLMCFDIAHARGLCSKHYARLNWRVYSGSTTWAQLEKAGFSIPPLNRLRKTEGKTCKICARPRKIRGLCKKHYHKWYRLLRRGQIDWDPDDQDAPLHRLLK